MLVLIIIIDNVHNMCNEAFIAPFPASFTDYVIC